MRCTENIQRIAARRGLILLQFDMDGEFESLWNKTSNVLINIVSCEDHVAEAERNIHTVKDRTRSTLASLNFQHIPKRTLIELIFDQLFWLNTFPNKNGLSLIVYRIVMKNKSSE